MIHYFDSSALVKHYVREPGTSTVNRMLASGTAAISRLTEAEISSALARRLRDGHLKSDQHHRALAALRIDLERIDVIELSAPVVAAVHSLLARHALRAGDALQLASALLLRDRLGPDNPMSIIVYDERLHRAAQAEGLRVSPRTLARKPSAKHRRRSAKYAAAPN